MFAFKLSTICCIVAIVAAQDYQEYQQARPAPQRLGTTADVKPTPIPILKQINRHNDDGSYTYGYEGADGSFKIETKLATGEVKGKYGYTDETGKVRIVEYGANKYGFQPSGEGITVAPPTLVDETTNKDGLQLDYEDEQLARQQQEQQQPQQKPYIARVSRPQYEQPQQQQQQQYRPAPQKAPQRQSFFDYEQPQDIQAQPQQQQQQQQYERAPTPVRQQIDNAGVVYAAMQRPARPEYTQKQTFASPSQQSYAAPQQQQVRVSQPTAYTAPIARQQPSQQQQYSTRPAAPQNAYTQVPQGRSTSILDQLAKDYALPAGGQALHDISFGYY